MRSALSLLLAISFVGIFLCACSSTSTPSGQDGGLDAGADAAADSGKDCSASVTAVNNAAVRRGLDPDTVCASSDPAIVKDFGAACDELKACEAK